MKDIEIYTSNTCPQCIKVKEFFKSKNIGYIEYNISDNLENKKRLIGMGYMSIPLTIINGNHVLGLDIARINRLLCEK